MPAIVRAMYVDHDLTLVDQDRPYRTPQDTEGDFSAFLGRVALIGHPNGLTVLLGSDMATSFGFPKRPPRAVSADHPTLASARRYGWHITELSPWMTFWRPGPTPDVHVGLMPWLSAGNFAFLDRDQPAEMTRQLYQFHRLATVPYHGSNSGLAAHSLMRDHHNGHRPMWQPNWADVPPARIAVEVPPRWRSYSDHGREWEHCYDAYAQYVTAAGSLPLALGPLTVHNTEPIDPGPYPTPGYYRVVTPPWMYSAMLPHPIGVNPQVGELRWITAPRLALLRELAEQDVMVHPEIMESWTPRPVQRKVGEPAVPDAGRVLRGWSGRVQDAIRGAREIGDPRLLTAIKGLHRHGIGLLARPGGRVDRPDWQAAIVANAECNQFRKIWRTFRETGRAPVEVEHDQVWYASDHADPNTDWPTGFPPGERPGGYVCKASRKHTTEDAR